MSGLVKGVKKVFKKAVKFVKKYWKPIVAAVAVYFTAGVALSYFGSTAAFASSLPGFGTAGVFSKAAVWMGFSGAAGSGIHSTAVMAGKIAGVAGTTSNTVGVLAAQGAATGTTVPTSIAGYNMATMSPTGAALTGGTGAAVGGTGSTLTSAVTPLVQAGGAGGGGGATTATDALIKALNTQSKLSMVKLGVDTISGLLAPDPYEEQRKTMREQHALQNASSFGVGRDGDSTFGWGSSNAPQQSWADMNKRGSSVNQSQFRDAQFVPTAYEQAQVSPQMPTPQGGSQFIPQGG